MKKLILITVIALSASPSFAWTFAEIDRCEAQGGTFVINGPNPGCRLP